MLIETRRDRIMAVSVSAGFAALVLLGALLQYHYGGALFFKRAIAGLAGCL